VREVERQSERDEGRGSETKRESERVCARDRDRNKAVERQLGREGGERTRARGRGTGGDRVGEREISERVRARAHNCERIVCVHLWLFLLVGGRELGRGKERETA